MTEDFLSGNNRAKPDFQLFDITIKACTVADNVTASDAFQAESILRRMWSLHEDSGLNVRPQDTTYKYVIVGFKKAEMAQRAEELLYEMERKSVGKPSKSLFQTVINAWHDSRHPDKQQHLNSLRLAMIERFGPKTSSGNGNNSNSQRHNHNTGN